MLDERRMTLADAARAIAAGGRLTVLTGAGVSAESGLGTFRDSGGLWENHALDDVATPEGFARDPRLVQRFYNERRKDVSAALPNEAHRALALLEKALGDRFSLITQNIDDLHERAGSLRVLHMHGEILKARCVRCGAVEPWTGDITPADLCACGAGFRPHVVWFGEMPFYMEDEIPHALRAEVFVSIGTSGVVYPAASFVAAARAAGSFTVEVNPEPSVQAGLFDFALRGKASERVPELARALLGDPPAA